MSNKSPSMVRSYNQLASSYAPGSLFTFEGGAGACLSVVPQFNAYAWDQLAPYVRKQSVIRINEAIQSWVRRASHSNDHPIPLDLCIDPSLIREGALLQISEDRIGFVSPEIVGYSLFPLSLVCSKCDRFLHFQNFNDFSKRESECCKPCLMEGATGSCRWRQLDVVFVHPSGRLEAPRPGNYVIPDSGQEQWLDDKCPACKQNNFKLNRSSPQIRNWYFYCGTPNCRGTTTAKERWMIYDPHTVRSLRRASQEGGAGEDGGGPINTQQANMRVSSYRASVVYYPMSVFFVLVPESQTELQRILESMSAAPIRTFVAERFKFHGEDLSDAEMEEALSQAGKSSEWVNYNTYRKLLDVLSQPEERMSMQDAMDQLMLKWTSGEPPILQPKLSLPPEVEVRLANRDAFSSQYDPFVLAVEHEALARGKLADKHSYVRFSKLNKYLAPRDEEAKKELEEKSAGLMSQLGLKEAGLIRDFEICKTTFGYTRVSAAPKADMGSQSVPVRLNLFDNIRTQGRRPAYLITQKNEALYFQLDSELVYDWLIQIAPIDLPEWNSTDPIPFGGKLLGVAKPFGQYMKDLHPGQPQTYWYVYTLLHTYAHQMMRTVALYSGLDAGSISEYLFPADLAFVVYRSGTTMDLGNMSSLWRNHNTLLFEKLLDNWTHQCNSGQLCDSGACPDCILVPETSCIASNQLLARSVLGGGQAPREDSTGRRIPGYIQMIQRQLHEFAE